MPVKSAAQFRLMQAAAHGNVRNGPSKSVAVEFLRKTSHKKKSQFAKAKTKFV